MESTNLFQSIRTVIEDSIEDEIQKAVILEKVDEIDRTKGTPTFKEKYLEFMQALGNHVTVISPFLQPFNQLLNI